MTPSATFEFERYPTEPSQWDDKLALVFDAESDDDHDRLVARMNAFDWDDAHSTWVDEYEWKTVDRDDGAWSIDCRQEIAYDLRTRGIPVPPIDDIPWGIETVPFPCGAPTRKCPKCHEMSIISASGCELVYPVENRSERMKILIDDASPATDLCTNSDCGQFYEHHGDMTAYLTPAEAVQDIDPEPADSLIEGEFET